MRDLIIAVTAVSECSWPFTVTFIRPPQLPGRRLSTGYDSDFCSTSSIVLQRRFFEQTLLEQCRKEGASGGLVSKQFDRVLPTHDF